jgi:cell wall-associated NlpC family hydrolase
MSKYFYNNIRHNNQDNINYKRKPSMKKTIIAVLNILIIITSFSVAAKTTLIEKIESDIKADQALSAQERKLYINEFKQQLGAYAFDILKGNNIEAEEVALSIVVEGTFGKIAVERTVSVAVAAYVAISRGAPADAVRGIALYGFSNTIEADKIEAWANGYHLCMKHGVTQKAVQELVYAAATKNWDLDTFNSYKWALVRAHKAGYDVEKYTVYLIGHHLLKTDRPGGLIRRANKAFKYASAQGPSLPKYKSAVIEKKPPKKPKEPKEPKPKIDKPQKIKPKIKISALLDKLKKAIESFLGTPYVWGGRSRRGTDCSGFTQTVFSEIGIELPRNSKQQWNMGKKVAYQNLKMGDLVFFITIGSRISHVGVVTNGKDKKFVHASSSRGVVKSDLKSKYYQKRYVGARRVL